MPMPQPRNYAVALTGGLDTESPDYLAQPGRLASAENYEVGINGGYQDIEGYVQHPLDAEGNPIAVPGTGQILGLFVLNNVLYCIRGLEGERHAIVYRDTPAGWEALSFNWLMYFSGGTGVDSIAKGVNIVGAQSDVAALTVYSQVQSGSFENGDAAGYVVLKEPDGRFRANETLQINGVDIAEMVGLPRQFSLQNGARVDSAGGNLAGQELVFLVSGFGRAIQFDGEDFVPVITNPDDAGADRPEYAAIHEARLFLSIGSNLFISAVGDPLNFKGVDGAAEINVGEIITGMNVEPGQEGRGSLSIFSENSIHIMHNDQTGNFHIANYRREIGAYPFSIQTLSYSVFADDWGIRELRTAQEFGNFTHTTLTSDMQSRWAEIVEGRTVTASCINRLKDQYRVFFNDGSGVYVTIRGRKALGCMPVKFPDRVNCAVSAEFPGVGERTFLGTFGGKVLELDNGTSFDGEPISAHFATHYDFMRSKGLNKKFLDMHFETRMQGYCRFRYVLVPDYGNFEHGIPPVEDLVPLGESTSAKQVLEADRSGGITVPITFEVGGARGENLMVIIGKISSISKPVLWAGWRCRYTYNEQVRQRHHEVRAVLTPRILGRYISGRFLGDPDLLIDLNVPDRMPAPSVEPSGNNSLTVSFPDPTLTEGYSDGNALIESFDIRSRAEGTGRFIPLVNPIVYDDEMGMYSMEFDDLLDDTRYEFQVNATNVIGPGRYSESGYGMTEYNPAAIFVAEE